MAWGDQSGGRNTPAFLLWPALSVLLPITMATLGAFLWLGGARTELASHADRLNALEQARQHDAETTTLILARLSGIEAQLAGLRELMQRREGRP